MMRIAPIDHRESNRNRYMHGNRHVQDFLVRRFECLDALTDGLHSTNTPLTNRVHIADTPVIHHLYTRSQPVLVTMCIATQAAGIFIAQSLANPWPHLSTPSHDRSYSRWRITMTGFAITQPLVPHFWQEGPVVA